MIKFLRTKLEKKYQDMVKDWGEYANQAKNQIQEYPYFPKSNLILKISKKKKSKKRSKNSSYK